MSLRASKLLLVLALTYPSTVAAQQVRVTDNVNVLPVYKSTGPGLAPGADDYLRGDLFGQRQNEPSIAVSSVNRDHVVAFYNDFRAVDIGADSALPNASSSTFATRFLNGVRTLWAKLTGRPAPSADVRGDPDLLASGGEAWIGMSMSYDGGTTWTGGFMPGHPDDTTLASTASPAWTMTGASDPVVATAPCGRFYVAFLAFNRGGESRLLVARFQDLNDSDMRHTLKYVGMTMIERALNATNGHFLDKPHIAVELTGNGCSAVSENVHVSYTTFVGGAGNKFTSKITVASSFDGGLTFTPAKVDDSYTQSQGTALVLNPVTHDLYVFWRSFTTPNSIIYSKKTPKGNWSKPVDLLATSPMAPFDQPTLTTNDTADKNQLAFRTNGFPAASITPDGKYLFLAWQERVTASGVPSTAEQPRIVVNQLNVATGAWSGRAVASPTADASPFGLGFFRPAQTSAGPQIMPSLACGAGNKCALTYYESRYALNGGWIAGYENVLDLRGVFLTPGPQATPSFQVSRYGYQPPAVWNDQNGQLAATWLTQVLDGTLDANTRNASQICPPWAPAGTCYPALDYGGYPHTGAGTSPFMGDYTDVQPVVPFVFKSGKWQVTTDPADVPSGAGFISAWADNRFVVRPSPNDGTEWRNFGQYQFPGSGGPSCVNPGSRDQAVMTARLDYGLLITTSTNYKPAGAAQVTYPVTVWNNTGQDKVFSLAFSSDSSTTASLAKEACPTCTPTFGYPLRDGERVVFAYSSSSFYVYVNDGTPVTLNVAEKCGSVMFDAVTGVQQCLAASSGLKGSLRLNDSSLATPANASFTYSAPDITANPVPKNPVPKNPVPKNPVPKNPVPKNATVYDVVDYSLRITATDPVTGQADTADVSSYLALFNVDKAYQDSYIFQVFVSKPTYAFDVVNWQTCDVSNVSLGTLVGHISDPSNPVPKNPVPKNPVPKNPVPKNATLSDALIQNSTFTLGSGDSLSGSSSGASGAGSATALGCDSATGAGLIAECTKAAPRQLNEVIVTLRAYQVVPAPARKFEPFDSNGQPLAPPSAFVADNSCLNKTDPACRFIQDGPELAAPVSAGVAPTTVPAGGTVTFPTAVQTVPNSGNRIAIDHLVGFYISAAATVAGLPRAANGTIDTASAATYTRLLASVPMTSLAAGSSEYINPQTLTIPGDIPLPNAGQTGTYYLYAYVDSTRVVSEFDEDNNILQGGPVTVIAPGYGFIGLQTPCNVGQLSCTKNGAGAVPVAWQFSRGGVAVDSFADKPRLKFYQGCTTAIDASVTPFLVANPGDLSTGSSSFQYFAAVGLSRPRYTWQYNWDRTNPSTGASLTGCYQLYIEVPSIGQVFGATNPALKPIGPIKITLQ